jgi:malic enzyme
MLYAASNALASFVSDDWIASGRIFPQVEDLRHIALHVAVAVAKAGIAEHVQQVEVPTSEPELAKLITRRMWNPQYPQIARVERL